MRYCKKCVEPESNPGLIFNNSGICNVCSFHMKKTKINWSKRLQQLKKIASWAKANSKSSYDCVIGVSGGKDSTKQALYARDILGLNCLLVNSSSDLITELGRYNLDNLCNHGFDMIRYSINPSVYKKLVRKSLEKYANPQKPSEYPLAATPLRVAINFNIPLVVHGENSALEMGEPKEFTAESDFSGNALGFANSNTVRGGHAKDWIMDGIEMKDILPYQYPSIEEIKSSGVQAIYLGYYLKEFNTFNNAIFAIKKGLKTRTDNLYDIGRYHRYSALDTDTNIINGMIKYIKFGYGSTTDRASLDIRAGKITRQEAIALVKEFDGLCAERFVKSYCDYLHISINEFRKLVEAYRGNMWKKYRGNKWRLENPIWEQEPVGNINIFKVIRRLNRELGINQDIE